MRFRPAEMLRRIELANVDRKHGLESLKKIWGDIGLARQRERLADEIYVRAAEAAIVHKDFRLARLIMFTYFGEKEHPMSQFFVRALFCRGVVEYEAGSNVRGATLAGAVSIASKYILRGIEIALTYGVASGNKAVDNDAIPYRFLVYNGSVYFWHVARALCVPGCSAPLLEHFPVVTKALEDVGAEEWLLWRARYQMMLGFVYADNGKTDDALKSLTLAVQLCDRASKVEELAAESIVVRNYVRRMTAYIGASSSAAQGKVRAGDSDTKNLLTLALASAGLLDPKTARKELGDILTSSKTAMAAVGASPSGAAAGRRAGAQTPDMDHEIVAQIQNRERDVIAERIGDVGLFSVQYGELDLAEQCGEFLMNQTTLVTARASAELIDAMLQVARLGAAKEHLSDVTVDARISSLKLTERALDTSMRMKHAVYIEKCCTMIWNISLPLLQPNLRPKIKRYLLRASSALEQIDDTSVNYLRAALHLELSRCEIEDDYLSKARDHAHRALCTEYNRSSSCNAEETGSKGKKDAGKGAADGEEDPKYYLDRQLRPLHRTLELKTSLYTSPSSKREEALLAIERASDAKDLNVREKYLMQALGTLDECLDAGGIHPLDERLRGDEKPTADERTRARFDIICLFARVMFVAWQSQNALLPDVARRASDPVLGVDVTSDFPSSGEPLLSEKDRVDFIVSQAKVAFILAETYVVEVQQEEMGIGQLTVDDLPLDFEDLSVEEEEELLAINRRCTNGLAENLLKGMEYGKAAGPEYVWLIVNGAIYFWNYHVHLMQSNRYYVCTELAGKIVERCAGEVFIQSHLSVLSMVTFAHAEGLKQQYLLEAISKAKDAEETTDDQDPVFVSDLRPQDEMKYVETGKSSSLEKAEGVLSTLLASCSDPADVWQRKLVQSRAQIQLLRGVQPANLADAKAKFPEWQLVARLTALRSLSGDNNAKTLSTLLSESYGIISATTANGTKAGGASGGGANHRASAKNLDKLKKSPTVDATPTSRLVDHELCSQVAMAAYTTASYEIASNAAGLCVTRAPKFGMSQRQWRWVALAHAVNGRSILHRLEAAPQEQQTAIAIQDLALTAMADGLSSAQRSRHKGLLWLIVNWFCGALRSMASTAQGRKAANPLVKRVLTILQEAKPRSAVEWSWLASLYAVRAIALCDDEQWSDGLTLCLEAMSRLPHKYHRSLIGIQLRCHVRLGREPAQLMSRLRGYPPATQAHAWLLVARLSGGQEDQIKALMYACEAAATGAQDIVPYLLETAIWTLESNNPKSHARDILLRCIDLLAEVEYQHLQKLGAEAAEAADDTRSGVSRVSRRSRYTARTSRSRRSRSSMRRSVASMRSSRSRSSFKSKSVASSKRSSRSKRKSGKNSNGEPVEKVPRLKVGDYETLIRVYALLATIAPDIRKRVDHLLNVVQTAVSMFRVSVVELNETAIDYAIDEQIRMEEQRKLEAEKSGNAARFQARPDIEIEQAAMAAVEKFELPFDVSEWVQYRFPQKLRTRLKAAAAEQVVNTRNMKAAVTTVRTLVHVWDELVKYGYDLRVAPLIPIVDLVVDDILGDDVPADAKTALKLKCEMYWNEILPVTNECIDAKRKTFASLQELSSVPVSVRAQQNMDPSTSGARAVTPLPKSIPLFLSQTVYSLSLQDIFTNVARDLLLYGRDPGQCRSVAVYALQNSMSAADQLSEGASRLLLAEAAELSCDYENALQLFKQSQQHITDASHWIRSYAGTARCLRHCGNFDEGVDILAHAASVFEELGRHGGMNDDCVDLTRCHAELLYECGRLYVERASVDVTTFSASTLEKVRVGLEEACKKASETRDALLQAKCTVCLFDLVSCCTMPLAGGDPKRLMTIIESTLLLVQDALSGCVGWSLDVYTNSPADEPLGRTRTLSSRYVDLLQALIASLYMLKARVLRVFAFVLQQGDSTQTKGTVDTDNVAVRQYLYKIDEQLAYEGGERPVTEAAMCASLCYSVIDGRAAGVTHRLASCTSAIMLAESRFEELYASDNSTWRPSVSFPQPPVATEPEPDVSHSRTGPVKRGSSGTKMKGGAKDAPATAGGQWLTCIKAPTEEPLRLMSSQDARSILVDAFGTVPDLESALEAVGLIFKNVDDAIEYCRFDLAARAMFAIVYGSRFFSSTSTWLTAMSVLQSQAYDVSKNLVYLYPIIAPQSIDSRALLSYLNGTGDVENGCKQLDPAVAQSWETLTENSVLWRFLVAAHDPVEQVVSKVPESTLVLSLHVPSTESELTHTSYLPVYATFMFGPSVLCCTRIEIQRGDIDKNLELWSSFESRASRSDALVDLQTSWRKFMADCGTLLRPLTAFVDQGLRGFDGDVLLLCDSELAHIPWEHLPLFSTAKSVTRGFSLPHMFLSPPANTGTAATGTSKGAGAASGKSKKGGSAPPASNVPLVLSDPLCESDAAQRTTGEEGTAVSDLKEIWGKDVREKLPKGTVVREGNPGALLFDEDIVEVLESTVPPCWLYAGFGPLFSCMSAAALANSTLQETNIAWIFDRLVDERGSRRCSKLIATRTTGELRAWEPYFTSLILHSRGIRAVVSTQVEVHVARVASQIRDLILTTTAAKDAAQLQCAGSIRAWERKQVEAIRSKEAEKERQADEAGEKTGPSPDEEGKHDDGRTDAEELSLPCTPILAVYGYPRATCV